MSSTEDQCHSTRARTLQRDVSARILASVQQTPKAEGLTIVWLVLPGQRFGVRSTISSAGVSDWHQLLGHQG
jgi:hypothetical protein